MKAVQSDASIAYEASRVMRNSAGKNLFDLVAYSKSGSDRFLWLFDVQATNKLAVATTVTMDGIKSAAIGLANGFDSAWFSIAFPTHWQVYARVQFTTTGVLPTGLSAATDYWLRKDGAYWGVWTTAGVRVTVADGGSGDLTITATDIPRAIIPILAGQIAGASYESGIPYSYGVGAFISSSAATFVQDTNANFRFEATYST